MNKEEILHRGKSINTRKWVTGDLIHRNIWGTIYYYIRTEDNGFEQYEEFQVFPETVGWYIGIKDGDNEKLFIKDIVRLYGGAHLNDGTFEYDETIVIETYDDIFKILESKYVKKIGNISDNPELLEGVK